jgi:anthranilate phosphoribosyltransferase
VQAFIKAVGAGKRRARDLTRAEAEQAMLALLDTRDDAQVGAFVLAMRMKGESATELAGFADALGRRFARRPAAPATLEVDAHGDGRAGRPSLLPAAAALAARAGLEVHVHIDRAGPHTRHFLPTVFDALGPLPGVTVHDLADDTPALKRLLDVRGRVGVRTFVSSLVKLYCGAADSARLVGIFHGPYHEPMARALALLGTPGLVVQAPGGLPEPPPDRPCKITASAAPDTTCAFDGRSLGDDVDAGPLPDIDSAAQAIALNRQVMDGTRGPARRAALVCAAAMLTAAGKSTTLAQAVPLLQSGASCK